MNWTTAELVTEWWNAIGIKTELVQKTREDYWASAGANEVMVATWTTDRGLVPMVDPIYQFPFDTRSWMGPAFGLWYKTGGTDGEEPPAEIKEVMDLYDQYKVTTDPAAQVEIGKQIVRIASTKLLVIGTVGLVPTPGCREEQLHECCRQPHCRLDHHDPRHAWTPRTSTSRTAATVSPF